MFPLFSSNKHPFPKERIRSFLRRIPWRRIGAAAAVSSAALLLLFLILIGRLIASAPDIHSISVSPMESATYICDEQGNPMRRLSLAASNRDIVSLDQISPYLQNAVVAIEDCRFYEHHGIDPKGILRAFWMGLTRGSFSEGASTITQQLIKNSVFTQWTQENSFSERFRRKVQEQYLALQLEKILGKEEILEDYLNTVNFGSGCYGAQSAAKRYFAKNASELSLSESAVLAAALQNPTGYDPALHPQASRKRQLTVLSYMEEQGYISSAEHKSAVSDRVYDRVLAASPDSASSSVYSYYEDALIQQVQNILMTEKGYSAEQAYRAVFSGGLRIYSAEDEVLQQICEEECSNPANFPAETTFGMDYSLNLSDRSGIVTHYGSSQLRAFIRQQYDASFDLLAASAEQARQYADVFREAMIQNLRTQTTGTSDFSPKNGTDPITVLEETLILSPQPQISLVLMDPFTGCVRAIVGGRGEKSASLTLNRASDSLRQPGSTFKILAAYAPALDACGQTLASLYENAPYTYQDGTPVSNWDENDYSGDVSIREAIVRSINVAAVRCITEITPQLGFSYAKRFGISPLHDASDASSDVIQPLALGGITEGVSNLELCGAYAVLANGGIYRTPRFFTRIEDRNGNLLFDFSATENTVRPYQAASSLETAVQRDNTRILKDSTAFLLTDALCSVVSHPDGTAYNTISAAGQPVSGKTGTTSDYRDIWFAGSTPYYTCSVWGGYDNHQSLPDSTIAHSYQKTVWSAVMNRVHDDLPVSVFAIPDSVTQISLCKNSHLRPVENGCSDTYLEYFADGTQPTQYCTLHEPAAETAPVTIYSDLLEQLLPQHTAQSDAENASEKEEPDAANPDSEEPNSGATDPSSEELNSGAVNPSSEDIIFGAANPSSEEPNSGAADLDSERSGAASDLPPQTETNSLDDLLRRLYGS